MEKAIGVHHREHSVKEEEKEMKFINLKQFRKERGLNQKQLVKDTGLPQSTVSYIENGFQKVYESQLDALRQAYPDADFRSYIYESDDYPCSKVKKGKDEIEHRNFGGDWSTPNPMCYIGNFKILLQMGRIYLSFDGDLILDRNDGTFEALGYHFIEPERLGSDNLINGLTEKEWFDDELYEDFKRCYPIACRLLGMAPVPQIKGNY